MSAFHRDIAVGRFIPKISQGPRSSALMRSLRMSGMTSTPDVEISTLNVQGPPGEPDVELRTFRPTAVAGLTPALLWVHGGGLVIGAPEQDDRTNHAFARELGITVAAVRYRLAPGHRAPAAVEDAYAGLRGLAAAASDLSIDPTRIAIGGASAGGGIAAALAQLALDRGEVTPVFQLLVYPMLDDRTVTRSGMDTKNVRVWTPKSNRFGWSSYLSVEPGSADVPPYSVPARRTDLAGLPPAWIGVGSLDLFHDEDLEYARRLVAAGVHTDVSVIRGAFHGFDALFPRAGVSKDFWRQQAKALRAALRR